MVTNAMMKIADNTDMVMVMLRTVEVVGGNYSVSVSCM